MSGLASFPDRKRAGEALATALREFAQPDLVVIGLPRGGVPVAAEVARALSAELDVICVRKLAAPWAPELGLGALAEDHTVVYNQHLVRESGLSVLELEEIVHAEQLRLNERLSGIRAKYAQLALTGKTVIVVDDGIATGIDAKAACLVAKRRGAAKVILAVPVAPQGWTARMNGAADEYIAVITPAEFGAVGQFYDDFTPTTEDEVLGCLADARA